MIYQAIDLNFPLTPDIRICRFLHQNIILQSKIMQQETQIILNNC